MLDDDVSGISNSILAKSKTESRELLKISDNISSENNNGNDHFTIDEGYERTITDKDFYSIVRSTSIDATEKQIIPWISMPTEFRSFTSIVFSSTDEIKANTTIIDKKVNLNTLLHGYGLSVLKTYINKLTEETKFEILRHLVGATETTYINFNFEEVIIAEFLEKTFLRLYTITSVVNTDDETLGYYVDSSDLNLYDAPNSVEVVISFERN